MHTGYHAGPRHDDRLSVPHRSGGEVVRLSRRIVAGHATGQPDNFQRGEVVRPNCRIVAGHATGQPDNSATTP
jgi:hypothetical protein